MVKHEPKPHREPVADRGNRPVTDGKRRLPDLPGNRL
jgi:hypothetical protein